MTILKIELGVLCLGALMFLSGCGTPESASTDSTSSGSVARVELVSDISTVEYDGSITLSWTTNLVENCVALGDWSGDRDTSGSEVQSDLVVNSTFELECSEVGSNEDGVASRGKKIESRVDIVVKGPRQPTLVLSASPTTIPMNGATTISWSTQHAKTCTASGGWTGDMATSGSITFNGLTENSTYGLSCTGAGGSVSQSVSIAIAAPSAPWVNLSASPSSISTGGSTTLSWDSGNATACTASGDWSGDKAVSGSQTITTITIDSSFTLTCTGAGGSANDSASITVTAQAPTLSLTATPATVNQNGSTTLVWSSTDATACTASLDWSGIKPANGSATITGLPADSRFRLNCDGPGGTVTKTVDVAVVLSSDGTALLSWNPPTEYSDGSLLNDELAGYKIRYGTSPGNYSETITIDNPGLSSYLVENLTSADWYFVMTAFDSAGVESSYSLEVSKTIN